MGWFSSLVGAWSGSSSTAPSVPVVARALHSDRRALRPIGNNRWELLLSPEKGYLPRLQGWQFHDRAEFVLFTDIVIHREWIVGEMGVVLLVDNDKLRYSSLRFIESRQGMELALGAVCPLPLYTEAALTRTVQEMIREANRVVKKLLDMQFIYPRTDDERSPSK